MGDLYIDDYSSKDASKFRDYLLDRGLLISSVKRVFSSIRSIINLSITEEGISCINAFSKTYMPYNDNVDIRNPIPTSFKRIQNTLENFTKNIMKELQATDPVIEASRNIILQDLRV